MRKLIYRKAASRDLREIADYIAENTGDFDAGLAFAEPFRAQCRRLAASPVLLGRPREELAPGLRGLLFRGYIIFFRCTDRRFEIIDIILARRDFASVASLNGDSTH